MTKHLIIITGLVGFLSSLVGVIAILVSAERRNTANIKNEFKKWQFDFYKDILAKLDNSLYEIKVSFSDSNGFYENVLDRNNNCEDIFEDIGYLLRKEVYDKLHIEARSLNNDRFEIQKISFKKGNKYLVENNIDEVVELYQKQVKFGDTLVLNLQEERLHYIHKFRELRMMMTK